MNLGFKGETMDSEGLIVGDVEIPNFDTEVSALHEILSVFADFLLSQVVELVACRRGRREENVSDTSSIFYVIYMPDNILPISQDNDPPFGSPRSREEIQLRHRWRKHGHYQISYYI